MRNENFVFVERYFRPESKRRVFFLPDVLTKRSIVGSLAVATPVGRFGKFVNFRYVSRFEIAIRVDYVKAVFDRMK